MIPIRRCLRYHGDVFIVEELASFSYLSRDHERITVFIIRSMNENIVNSTIISNFDIKQIYQELFGY